MRPHENPTSYETAIRLAAVHMEPSTRPDHLAKVLESLNHARTAAWREGRMTGELDAELQDIELEIRELDPRPRPKYKESEREEALACWKGRIEKMRAGG